jgi:hypothetical protein
VKAAEPHERPYLKESPEFIQLDGDIKSSTFSPLHFDSLSHEMKARSADE